jgi:NAD(P)H-dependent FMN reductase
MPCVVHHRVFRCAICDLPGIHHWNEPSETPAMLKIAIILGSTRPERNGEAVAHWVNELAQKRTDAEFELIDLAEVDLPFLDEAIPPSQGKYAMAHTKEWAARVDAFDAFVIVTPEYNHSFPAVLKNAIDFLYKEWNNKAAGFVSYGAVNGARAVEQLRLVLAEVQVATVRAQVGFSLMTDFKDMSEFTPAARHEKELSTMLGQLSAWGQALKEVRKSMPKGIEEKESA